MSAFMENVLHFSSSMQWNTLLKSLGFTDSESKLYLLSLEIGPTSVQDLAKKAKVSRVTTYAAIETLSGRGLMSSVQKGKKTVFAAESPERLISFVHTQVKQMESTLRDVESLIGDLKLLQRGEKPVVKMFEGLEGLHAIQDDILKSNPKVVYELTNNDAIESVFALDDLTSYQRGLQKKKIRAEVIGFDSKKIPQTDLLHAQQLSGEPTFHGNISIYADKVAMVSFQGKSISVLIESAVLAQTMRELFKLAQKGAEKR